MNLKDDTRTRALLLHYVGENVHHIYEASYQVDLSMILSLI